MKSLFDTHTVVFERYCEELLLWGETHNITGYKTRKDIMQNIADSIAPLDFIGDFKTALDIGSGCGFPAIPLAICKADSEFILVEPQVKRASFLNIIAINLGLKNVTILKNRIELVESLPKIDLITSRAFSKSSDIIGLCERFLDESGHFLFYKSPKEFKKDNHHSKIFYFYKSKSEALQWQKSC